LVTNRLTMPGDALIRWHRERCGMSEKAHAVMKDDLAGGKMPSNRPRFFSWTTRVRAMPASSAASLDVKSPSCSAATSRSVSSTLAMRIV
jgi:hypothetical protein